MVAWGEFTPFLEDMARLTMLPMFVETNAMGVVLEERDEMKLMYMTSVIITPTMSGKSTYTTWPQFFDEGDGSRSCYVVEAFLTY